jgi:hypothetical protein
LKIEENDLPEYLPPLRLIIPHTIAMMMMSTIIETMRPMNQGEVITRGARSKQKKMSFYIDPLIIFAIWNSY